MPEPLVHQHGQLMAKLPQSCLVLFVGRKPRIDESMMPLQQIQPLIENGFFRFIRGLLLEEYRTRGSSGYLRVLLTQKVERLDIEEFQRARSDGATLRVSDKREYVGFFGEEDHAAQQPLRF